MVINKSLKNVVKEQFKRHRNENLDDYVDGKLTVFDRRVLKTKCVGNSWERIYESKDIIRSLKKCGIATNVNDSEDSQMNIRG